MPVFFTFFKTLGLICLKFCPKSTTHFIFADFQWIMLGYPININNFNCNPVVVKEKFRKTSKNYHFWTQLAQKRGHYRPRPI